MLEGHYSTRENLMSIIYVHEDNVKEASVKEDKSYDNIEDYFSDGSTETNSKSSGDHEKDAEDLLRDITGS